MTDATLTQRFERCLKTLLRYGTKPEEQRYYFLPYTGNLTGAKFDQLAERLTNEVAPLYRNMTADQIRAAMKARLESEWYTGREKWVSFERNASGSWTISGENWWMFSTPKADFEIVG